MEEILNEYNSLYEDLKILSQYEIELRTKQNIIKNNGGTQEEKDMLDADLTSLFMLIQEKIDLIDGLKSTLLEYYERGGIADKSKVEELIKGEEEIIRVIYKDNNGLDRYFESTVLDREEYNEIRNRIDKLERESKKLQPKIEGSQKSFKKQILRSSGFVEASNGKLIHPSIIDEYENLLTLKSKLDIKFKETYTLKEKYDEILNSVKTINPGLTDDQIAEILKRKRDSIIDDADEEKGQEQDDTSEGTDDSVEDLYEKLKKTDKKDVGKFLSILSELIRKRLSLLNEDYLKSVKTELIDNGYSKDKVDSLTLDDLAEVIKNNPLEKDIIKLLMDYLNNMNAKHSNGNNDSNNNSNPVIVDEESKKKALKAYEESGYGQNAFGHYFNIWIDEYDPNYKPWEDKIYLEAINKHNNQVVIDEDLKKKALRIYEESGYGQNAYGHYFNIWMDEYDPDYKPWEDDIYLNAAKADKRPIGNQPSEGNENSSDVADVGKEEPGIYFGKGKNDYFEPKTFEHEVKEAKERLKPTVEDLELKRFIDGVNPEKIRLQQALNPELSLDEIVMFLAKKEYEENQKTSTEDIIRNFNDDELDDFEEFGDKVDKENDITDEKIRIKDKRKSKGKAKEAIKSALASLMSKGLFKAVKNFIKKRKEKAIEAQVEDNNIESGYSK